MATIRRKKSESFAILSSPGPWPQVLINWLATLAVIIVFGLIMLFSASYTTGYLRMGDSFYYIKSQVFCLGLGLAVMLLFSRIDHRFLRRMGSSPLSTRGEPSARPAQISSFALQMFS